MQLQESSQSKLLHIGLSNQSRLIPDTLMTAVSQFVSPFRNCQTLIGSYVNITEITKKWAGYVIGCQTNLNGNYVQKFTVTFAEPPLPSKWIQTDFMWDANNYKSNCNFLCFYIFIFLS